MLIYLVCAARPNPVKVAPLYHAFKERALGSRPILIHTGQDYD